MWQRFTEDARKIIWGAQEEAQNLGQRSVRAEHLLLALLRDEGGTAALALTRCGIRRDQAQGLLRARVVPEGVRWDGEMTLSRDGKEAIDGAYSEARRLGNTDIGPEHILLGLLHDPKRMFDRVVRHKRPGSIAMDVLNQLGLQLEAVRRVVLEIQTGSMPESNYPRPNRG
jgi:ATP-dependent Clp protease ATP-binding subunit ClpC